MHKSHIVEIGCAGVSSLHHLIVPQSNVQIFEPLPYHFEATRLVYSGMPNVIVRPYAIWKERGHIDLFVNGLSTFAEGLSSPALANDDFQCDGHQKITVEARTFDEFDDGTIDLIEIDTEGGEWYVIERMISRPFFIIVEMQWKNYKNPFFDQIVDWMRINGYEEFQRHEANFTYKKIV